jgi:hypothetical protein
LERRPAVPSSTSNSSQWLRPPWALAWTLALLLACELLVRARYDPLHVDPEFYAANFPDHGYAFTRARPRCWRSPGQIDCYGDEYQPIPHQTVADPKPPGTLRIIVIGTSPAFGPKSYPALLAEPLAERLGRAVEVLNFSARGRGTTRMLEQHAEALTLDPDLIILHPHGTNEYEDEREGAYARGLLEGVAGVVRRSEYATLLQKLAASQVYAKASKVVDLRRSAKQQAEADAEADPGRDFEAEAGRNPLNRRRWRATLEANVEAMVASSRAAGLGVVLIGRAQRPGSPDYEWVPYLDGFLGALAEREQGVTYVDPMAVLEQKVPNLRSAFFDVSHLNDHGNRMLAPAVVEQLVEVLHELGRPM